MRRPNAALDDAGTAAAGLISSTGEWIRSADNKAAILGGFAVAIAAGLITDTDQIAVTLRAGGIHGWTARGIFFAATTSLLIAVTLLLSVLWPRTREPDRPNRHAFPSVARRRIAAAQSEPGASNSEAAVQGQILASIAMTKFRLVKVATLVLATSFVLLIAWRIVVSTLTP